MRDLLVDDSFARGEETDHLGPKADPRVPITNFLYQAFVKERSVVPPSPWLSGLLVSMTSQSVVFSVSRVWRQKKTRQVHHPPEPFPQTTTRQRRKDRPKFSSTGSLFFSPVLVPPDTTMP